MDTQTPNQSTSPQSANSTQAPSSSSVPPTTPPTSPPEVSPTKPTVPPASSAGRLVMGKKTLLLLLLLIIAVCAAYVFTKNNVSPQPKKIVVTATPTVVPSPTVVTRNEWYPFEAPDYNIAFAYPSVWGKATTSQLTASQGALVNQTTITFAKDSTENPQGDTVTFTKYKDYTDQNEVNLLKNIFLTQKVAENKPLWLPPSNAGITHYSNPTYIENAKGTLRGIYYFARVAQNLDDPWLNTLFLILTDGKENIMTVAHRAYPPTQDAKAYPIRFEACNSHTATGSATTECMINKGVFDSLSTYKEFASKAAVMH